MLAGCQTGNELLAFLTQPPAPQWGAAPPAGGAAQAPDAPGGRQSLRLPSASSGEACEIRRLVPTGPSLTDEFIIRCGGADTPSASVLRTLNADFGPEDAVVEHPWAEARAREGACGGAEPAALPGSGATARLAFVRSCVSDPGQFPMYLGAAEVGRWVVLFHGAAQTAPVMEAVVAAMVDPGLTPTSPAPAGTPTLASRMADRLARLGARDLPLATVMAFGDLDREARAYAAEGDRQGALLVRREMRSLHASALGAEAPGQGALLVEEAQLLDADGRTREVGAALEAAAPLVARSAVPRDRRRLSVARARHALSVGRTADVAALLDAATGAAPDGGAEEMASVLAEVDLLVQAGLIRPAADRLEAARRIASGTPGGDMFWGGDMAARAAAIAERQGEAGAARTILAEAVDRHRRLFGADARLADLLIRRARLDAARGDTGAALAAWAEAFPILLHGASAEAGMPAEAVGAYLDLLLGAGDGTRTAAMGDARRPHLEAAFVAVQGPQPSLVWQARGRMARALAGADPGLANLLLVRTELEREAAVARQALARERSRGGTGTERRQTAATAMLSNAEAQLAEADRRIAARSPRYDGLRRPQPVEAAAMARLLSSDEALALVHVAPDRSTVIVLRADGALAGHRRGPGAAAFAAGVAAVRRAAQTGGLPDPQTLGALRNGLFAPLGPALDGVRHLVLVPSGPLFDLPPALLGSGRGPAISVVPTAASFATLRRRPPQAMSSSPVTLVEAARGMTGAGGRRALSGLAGLCVRASDGGGMPGSHLSGLPRLPTAELRQELDVATSVEAANPGALLAGLRRTGTVVVGGHALLPDRLRCRTEPALATAGGLLGIGEIARADGLARAVLLPFADGGPAEGAAGGESIAALADALIVAGADLVVAAHWRMDGASAARQLETFLSRGAGAEALREAQAREAARGTPRIWAPLALYGDGRGYGRPSRTRVGRSGS
ncbi:MAG TPA: CHAT domain-containing protein [Azospirillaceae bacterium]|nr:CHAT domain-containing protein [Azospirillaceae bacterium]